MRKNTARKIYLASASPARKKLLRSLGIPFKTMSSDVEEMKTCRGVSFCRVARENALLKAHAVAGKLKEGLVIGADTIVEMDGKPYGKPANLKDARKMLRELSGRSQKVHTGLAVVDAASGRQESCSVSTKIYMDKLSDKEMEDYFKQEDPRNMAGSFDVQGKGAFFVSRIEGCFYNVVGLPIRQLYRMLKKFGAGTGLLVALCFWAGVLLTGCSPEYNIVTGKEEAYFYSTDREVAIGKSVSKELEKEEKLYDDPLVAERVRNVGKKIAAVCDRKDIDYTFQVLKDEEVNAVSLPGGYVYVFKGLVDKVSNDDELAAVLSHEVGHIVARHSIKRLQAGMAYSLLRLLAIPVPNAGAVVGAADAAITTLMLGYSREDELLADQLGARYCKEAGYNPEAMISFLRKLHDIDRRKPLRERNYLRTHPFTPDRIRVVKEELGRKMEFSDYINIEDEKSK